MDAEMTVDTAVLEMRKLAAELRSEAEKVRAEEGMDKQASFIVDVNELKELIHGNI